VSRTGRRVFFVALGLSLAAGSILVVIRDLSIQRSLERSREHIALLEKQIRASGEIYEEVRRYHRELAELEQRVAVIQNLNRAGCRWSTILDRLERATPDSAEIVRLSGEGNKLSVRLESPSAAELIEIRNALESSQGLEAVEVRKIAAPTGRASGTELTATCTGRAQPSAGEDG